MYYIKTDFTTDSFWEIFLKLAILTLTGIFVIKEPGWVGIKSTLPNSWTSLTSSCYFFDDVIC